MDDSPITLFETFDTVVNEATKKHNKTVTAKILSKIDIDIDEKALTQALIQDKERYEEAYRKGYEDGVAMAVNAKDIPLEPIQPKELHRVGMGYDYDDWGCPNCECWLAGEPNIDGIPKRCPNCGQLLDLSKLRR